MSEFLREAIRLYMEEREWLRTLRYERLRDPRGRAGRGLAFSSMNSAQAPCQLFRFEEEA